MLMRKFEKWGDLKYFLTKKGTYHRFYNNLFSFIDTRSCARQDPILGKFKANLILNLSGILEGILGNFGSDLT